MPTPRRSSRCCARSTVPAGSGKVTDKILPVIENNTILGINNTTLGPDPAPRKKKELLVMYTQDNQVRFLQIPEKTDFSVDCFQKK